MRDVCEAAETLRLAADYQRQMASLRRVALPWEMPLADWLDEAAASAARHFEAVQSPSRGVDLEPGVAYGDPGKANRLTAAQYPNALRVARAILGDPAAPTEDVSVKGDRL